jgi:hypothetical protein
MEKGRKGLGEGRNQAVKVESKEKGAKSSHTYAHCGAFPNLCFLVYTSCNWNCSLAMYIFKMES